MFSKRGSAAQKYGRLHRRAGRAFPSIGNSPRCRIATQQSAITMHYFSHRGATGEAPASGEALVWAKAFV
jgi:hypothetical protein